MYHSSVVVSFFSVWIFTVCIWHFFQYGFPFGTRYIKKPCVSHAMIQWACLSHHHWYCMSMFHHLSFKNIGQKKQFSCNAICIDTSWWYIRLYDTWTSPWTCLTEAKNRSEWVTQWRSQNTDPSIQFEFQVPIISENSQNSRNLLKLSLIFQK